MNQQTKWSLALGGIFLTTLALNISKGDFYPIATGPTAPSARQRAKCHGNGCKLNSPDIWSLRPRDITSLCDSNGIACRDKYDGKTVRITGKFAELTEEWLTNGWLSLDIDDPTEYFSTVTCQIAPVEDRSVFYNYRKGMHIQVQGTIEIDNIRPQIENCQIISELP